MSNDFNVAIEPPLTLAQFCKHLNFPRSTISFMLALPDNGSPRPNFYRIGRRLFISQADARKFLEELSQQGYVPRSAKRRTKRAVRGGGVA